MADTFLLRVARPADAQKGAIVGLSVEQNRDELAVLLSRLALRRTPTVRLPSVPDLDQM